MGCTLQKMQVIYTPEVCCMPKWATFIEMNRPIPWHLYLVDYSLLCKKQEPLSQRYTLVLICMVIWYSSEKNSVFSFVNLSFKCILALSCLRKGRNIHISKSEQLAVKQYMVINGTSQGNNTFLKLLQFQEMNQKHLTSVAFASLCRARVTIQCTVE